MAIILGIYIILCGPILYYILKRKDRRDWMWFGVPALSVLCLLALYVFGFGTRYSKPIINSISEIEYNDGEDYLSVDTKMAVFNNKRGNLSIQWNTDDNIAVSGYTDRYSYGMNNGEKKVKGKILTGSDMRYESLTHLCGRMSIWKVTRSFQSLWTLKRNSSPLPSMDLKSR